MPEATLHAFADHGKVEHALPVPGEARDILRRAEQTGIDLDAITRELEREGVGGFCDSYRELLEGIQAKVISATPAGEPGSAERVGN
jgi:transaldolase